MIREFMVKNIGFPIAEKLKGWPVTKYLREYEESQWWSADRIRETQNTKLASLIEHAYLTVPFYKRIMDERGIVPADIRTVEDLPKLPILTKNLVRKHLPEMVSSNYDVSSLVMGRSSGSTGEPFRYYISQDEKARKWAALYLLWEWAGYELGNRHVNFVVGAHRAFTSNKMLMFLESKLSGILTLSALELYESNAQDYLKQIVNFKPKVVRGYPSSLFHLAQLVQQSSVDIKVSAVCTTGETLFEFQRELIESVFGCKVYDGYGGEGIVVSGQCGCDSAYHMNATSVIVEIVDPEGNLCKPGVEGQVVLTELNRYAMPFIRYNIQDVAALSDHTCSCGRGLPMLSAVSGRLTDIGVTPSGKSIIVEFFTRTFSPLYDQVKSFQVIQERPDLFVINIVPGNGFEEIRRQIFDKISEYLGSDVKLEIVTMDEIPTTSAGKRRLFISKCGIKAAGLSDTD